MRTALMTIDPPRQEQVQPNWQPPRLITVQTVVPEPPRCTPEQHVWLKIPTSYICDCGGWQIVNDCECKTRKEPRHG